MVAVVVIVYGDVVGRQAVRVEVHRQLALLPPDDLGDGDVALLFDPVFDFGRDAPQGVVVGVFAPEGQRQDGYVVDVARFDQRRGGRPGNAVEVGGQLGLQPDNGLFFVLPD